MVTHTYDRVRFDGFYDSGTPQEALYEFEIESLLDSAFNGLNTTVFAYGNTGAGTHIFLPLLFLIIG